jgi:leucyl-tRNA synthetase
MEQTNMTDLEKAFRELAAAIAPHLARELAAQLKQFESSYPPINEEALTTDQICARYSVSRAKLHTLRKEGLPHYFVGDSPRFDAKEVHDFFTQGQ